MRREVRERAETYFDSVSASESSRGSSERSSDGVSPAHDWHHVERVARIAETLTEEYDADEDVLFAAVWLHDIGRAREDRGEIDDHAEWGAREAGEILRDLGADAETVEAVQHCVRAHRYSNDVEPETREAEILSDADNLDALGAVGIARCFSYGGELGSPIHDPDLPPEADDSPVGETQFNHLHKKVLALPERMYTEAGREVAEERRAYVAEFAERFEREVAGDA
ncbi:HD domain-containing protein [Halorussus sp. MSC15.2]|uniref:HD domain-containing protein n=1 Tax=Halorussus sp. MSC15.2 TaxID=2283638 RepID=UPI0013D80B88|nr:HD domain-containing protein [Halorussus sp. MSC15.2]NEU55320.1 HD domain-containing protein [Halorussus sp. MSC15.2]